MELLCRVYDHVSGKTVKGFNMLTLGWTDGYSFIPVGFNMLSSAFENKRLAQASYSIDKRKSGYKARQDAMLQKPQAAVKMIRDALNAGVQASYVLMDTWFTNEPFIKEVVSEGIDVIGMLKDNKQRYYYRGKRYNLKQLSKFIQFSTVGDIFGSVHVTTMKHQIPVKIIFVKNRNKKSEYITILTTDCNLAEGETIRIYGNRWSIELFSEPPNHCFALGMNSRGSVMI